MKRGTDEQPGATVSLGRIPEPFEVLTDSFNTESEPMADPP